MQSLNDIRYLRLLGLQSLSRHLLRKKTEGVNKFIGEDCTLTPFFAPSVIQDTNRRHPFFYVRVVKYRLLSYLVTTPSADSFKHLLEST